MPYSYDTLEQLTGATGGNYAYGTADDATTETGTAGYAYNTGQRADAGPGEPHPRHAGGDDGVRRARGTAPRARRPPGVVTSYAYDQVFAVVSRGVWITASFGYCAAVIVVGGLANGVVLAVSGTSAEDQVLNLPRRRLGTFRLQGWQKLRPATARGGTELFSSVGLGHAVNGFVGLPAVLLRPDGC